MHSTDRTGRAPVIAGPRPQLPPAQALDVAGLVTVESAQDGLCHVVHQVHYAAELARPGPGRVRGVCGDLLLPGSLGTGSGLPCARCVIAPVVTVASGAYAREHADRRRRFGRVANLFGVGTGRRHPAASR